MAVRTIRIHPACAGSTRQLRTKAIADAIFPACARVNPPNNRLSFVLVIHPACAGVNLKRACAPRSAMAFSPHTRGSTLCHCAKTDKRGFTPHARGSTLPDCNSPQQNAILPACAGGGQPLYKHLQKFRLLFSPHARGSTRFLHEEARRSIILPARAGVNLKDNMPNDSCHDSPRMRGGQPLFERLTFKVTGFTPHARGSTSHSFRVYTLEKILPACAGGTLCRHR